MLGMISSILVFQLGQARVWFAMSRDGLLPKVFGKIHTRFRKLDEHNQGSSLVAQMVARGAKDNWIGEPTCVMFRRQLALDAGGFRTDIFQLVDVDFWMRLMLRPTESPLLFLQQLGRGLRMAPGKSLCTVLDFGWDARSGRPPRLAHGQLAAGGPVPRSSLHGGRMARNKSSDFEQLDFF